MEEPFFIVNLDGWKLSYSIYRVDSIETDSLETILINIQNPQWNKLLTEHGPIEINHEASQIGITEILWEEIEQENGLDSLYTQMNILRQHQGNIKIISSVNQNGKTYDQVKSH